MKKRQLLALCAAFSLLVSSCSLAANMPATITPLPSPLPSATVAAPTVPAAPTATLPLRSVSDFPDASGYTWNLVAGGLRRPVNMTNAADGSGRLFILEQAGLVRVVSNGKLQPTPFLDIRQEVGSSGNEQGLLGIAFHPDFKQNGFFFVDYTDRDGNTVISRFSADVNAAPAVQIASPGSEKIILRIKQPFANHNGGHIVFGPDGMLWIGMGDGGSQGDPNNNGQSVHTLFGQIAAH